MDQWEDRGKKKVILENSVTASTQGSDVLSINFPIVIHIPIVRGNLMWEKIITNANLNNIPIIMDGNTGISVHRQMYIRCFIKIFSQKDTIMLYAGKTLMDKGNDNIVNLRYDGVVLPNDQLYTTVLSRNASGYWIIEII